MLRWGIYSLLALALLTFILNSLGPRVLSWWYQIFPKPEPQYTGKGFFPAFVSFWPQLMDQDQLLLEPLIRLLQEHVANTLLEHFDLGNSSRLLLAGINGPPGPQDPRAAGPGCGPYGPGAAGPDGDHIDLDQLVVDHKSRLKSHKSFFSLAQVRSF